MSVSALCDEETNQTMIAIAMTGWLYRSITVPTCIFGLDVRDKNIILVLSVPKISYTYLPIHILW